MNRNEKKEYLNQYIAIKSEINDYEEEVEQIWAEMTNTTTSFSFLPKSSNQSDKIQLGVERLIELYSHLSETRRKRVNTRYDIEDRIIEVSDPTLRVVLIKKHIKGKTLDVISEEINYSLRQTANLYHKALDSLDL